MKKIEGLWTALVTPFTDTRELDEEGFRENLQRQKKATVDGIVALGTTGESPTLNQEEKRRVVEICLEELKGTLPLMVGTGTNSTQETIQITQCVARAGVDAALVVTPYYNRPTQEGIFRHFEAITNTVSLPIVVYNIPSRTGQNIEIATLRRIAALPNIIGVKEASGSIQQIDQVLAAMEIEKKEFSVISGDDALTFPLMALGGTGVISVLSNLIPEHMVAFVRQLQAEQFTQARESHRQLTPLFEAIFLETNPIPIKAMMNAVGMAAGPCRLPLTSPKPDLEPTLIFLAEHYGQTKPQFCTT